MNTREGLVDREGAKIKWTKMSYLKPDDPPPVSRSNLSKQIQILTQTLNYKQQYYLSPSDSVHYKRVGPEASGISKQLYDQILDHAIELKAMANDQGYGGTSQDKSG